jgi:hypothetical protein
MGVLTHGASDVGALTSRRTRGSFFSSTTTGTRRLARTLLAHPDVTATLSPVDISSTHVWPGVRLIIFPCAFL